MKKYYFTFGSDPGFPFQDTYIVIKSSSISNAIKEFRKRYPDRAGNEGIVNCSFIYTEEEWESIDHYYENGPALAISAESSFEVETKAGMIHVEETGDPECPGVMICLVLSNGTKIPISLLEVPESSDEDTVNLVTYVFKEDYTEKQNIKIDDLLNLNEMLNDQEVYA